MLLGLFGFTIVAGVSVAIGYFGHDRVKRLANRKYALGLVDGAYFVVNKLEGTDDLLDNTGIIEALEQHKEGVASAILQDIKSLKEEKACAAQKATVPSGSNYPTS